MKSLSSHITESLSSSTEEKEINEALSALFVKSKNDKNFENAIEALANKLASDPKFEKIRYRCLSDIAGNLLKRDIQIGTIVVDEKEDIEYLARRIMRSSVKIDI